MANLRNTSSALPVKKCSSAKGKLEKHLDPKQSCEKVFIKRGNLKSTLPPSSSHPRHRKKGDRLPSPRVLYKPQSVKVCITLNHSVIGSVFLIPPMENLLLDDVSIFLCSNFKSFPPWNACVMRHFKLHRGEKSNEWNQFFTCSVFSSRKATLETSSRLHRSEFSSCL